MKDGLAANGSQSAQAMALYLGLVPEKDVPAAEKILIENIKEKGYSLDTGIFSTRYALMYLSEHGYDEIAEKIVLNRKFPGWLYMLDCGATTIWETWKESDNIYSNCHPMFGSVDEWMLRFRSK
jgi:alpha-L-rhamnosidase